MSKWKAHYILKIIPEEKKIQVDATIQLQQDYDEIWLEIPTYSFDELISDVRAFDKEGNLLPLENVSIEGKTRTYTLKDVSTFHPTNWGSNAWFVLGKFRLHQKTIRGVELTSVICGEEYAFSDATFFSILTQLLDGVMDFYGSETVSQLFVAVTPWLKDKDSVGGTVTHESRYVILALSSDIDDKELTEKVALIAHELFHTGIPHIHTSKGAAYWFSEGFTKYYEHIIMSRLGFTSPEAFWQSMALVYQIYENAYEKFAKPNQLSLADCSFQMFRSKEASCIVYQGGAIVALMLDIQIRCATENACSLDDVMREMFFHSRQLGSLKQGDFATILQEVCGQDLEDTLTNYVDAAEKLPLNEVLSLIGLEYYDGQIRIVSDKARNQLIRTSIKRKNRRLR